MFDLTHRKGMQVKAGETQLLVLTQADEERWLRAGAAGSGEGAGAHGPSF